MAERLQTPLPMWQLQYHLLGGHRRMVALVVVAAGILSASIFGTTRLIQQPFSVIGPYVLWFLTAIQAFILLLAGTNAIHRAMLRDQQSRMIESHRLTPLSNITVVLGYLFGATVQILALFAVISVIGVVVCRTIPVGAAAWTYGNLLLLVDAVMLWSAAVFFGMRQEKPFNAVPLVAGCAALMYPIAMVPILGMMTGVYPAFFGIWLMTGSPTLPAAALWLISGACVGLSLFWLTTAAVKYRRPDLPVLRGARGLVLIAASVALGAFGIVAFEKIVPSAKALNEFYDRDLPRVQWIVTMIGGLLLSGVVVAGSVRCRVLGSRGTALRGRSDRLPPFLVALLSAVLICAVMAGLGKSIWPGLLDPRRSELVRENFTDYAHAWLWTVAVCLLATLSLRAVFEIGYRWLSSPKGLCALFFTVVWGLPPIIDSFRIEFMRGTRGGADYSWLTGCSPPGMIAAIWTGLDIRLWPGLVAQVLLLAVLSVVANSARRRDRRPANKS